MTLFKTTIFSFIATAIKMVAALIINKAVAIYIGPTGLALVGQFQSFTQMMIIVAQGALNTGTTKFTAEYGKEDECLPALFSTASLISLASSVIVGIGIGALDGKAMRIAHMGYANAPMLFGTLGAIEMGLKALGIPHGSGGVQAAIEYLAENVPPS